MCEYSDFSNLKLDPPHRKILKDELKQWHRVYLPKDGADGTVLDVGAGNGETAQFFLNHGAEHVICVEPYTDLLVQNFGRDSRVTIVPKAVNLIKVDCEGGERNMVIEVHFQYRWVKLKEGVNLKTIRLEEYWGNPARKAVVKGVLKLMSLLRLI
jgi:hypothetical protein